MPTYRDVVKTMCKVACMQKGLEKWELPGAVCVSGLNPRGQRCYLQSTQPELSHITID